MYAVKQKINVLYILTYFYDFHFVIFAYISASVNENIYYLVTICCMS